MTTSTPGGIVAGVQPVARARKFTWLPEPCDLAMMRPSWITANTVSCSLRKILSPVSATATSAADATGGVANRGSADRERRGAERDPFEWPQPHVDQGCFGVMLVDDVAVAGVHGAQPVARSAAVEHGADHPGIADSQEHGEPDHRILPPAGDQTLLERAERPCSSSSTWLRTPAWVRCRTPASR